VDQEEESGLPGAKMATDEEYEDIMKYINLE